MPTTPINDLRQQRATAMCALATLAATMNDEARGRATSRRRLRQARGSGRAGEPAVRFRAGPDGGPSFKPPLWVLLRSVPIRSKLIF